MWIHTFAAFVFLVKLSTAQEFRVLDYGAVGDGNTSDTTAIRAALTAAANNSGGRVIFDAGYQFLTGPLDITSNVILDVRGTIVASVDEFSNYESLINEDPWYSYWGTRTRHPVIQSYNATNVTITGGGIINGNGDQWYYCSNYNISIYPCKYWCGPFLVKLIYTDNILIENITLFNSPRWTLVLSWSSNARVNRVNITSPSGDLPSTGNGIENDGYDIVNSVNITVENSYYKGGDDAISAKSTGGALGRATENVLFRNMTIEMSCGIGLGVDTGDNIRNVTYRDINVINATRGLNVQSFRGVGGVVEDITFSNIRLINVNRSFIFSLYYDYNNNTSNSPVFKNMLIENFTVDNSGIDPNGFSYVWIFRGLPESVIQNITLRNINITNSQQLSQESYCTQVTGTCSNVFPKCPTCLPGPSPPTTTSSTLCTNCPTCGVCKACPACHPCPASRKKKRSALGGKEIFENEQRVREKKQVGYCNPCPACPIGKCYPCGECLPC